MPRITRPLPTEISSDDLKKISDLADKQKLIDQSRLVNDYNAGKLDELVSKLIGQDDVIRILKNESIEVNKPLSESDYDLNIQNADTVMQHTIMQGVINYDNATKNVDSDMTEILKKYFGQEFVINNDGSFVITRGNPAILTTIAPYLKDLQPVQVPFDYKSFSGWFDDHLTILEIPDSDNIELVSIDMSYPLVVS